MKVKRCSFLEELQQMIAFYIRGMRDVRVKNVCKSYEGFAVKNISFTLPRGYIMGFVGPNGAGKSTTIKMIMNLIKR